MHEVGDFERRVKDYVSALIQVLGQGDQAAEIVRALTGARRVFTAGNGGSAATASHLAQDLTRAGVPSICLSDNVGLLTAEANDSQFRDAFANILKLYDPRPVDVLVLISASGNSLNILEAALLAKERGAFVLALVGFGGGQLKTMAQISLVIPSHDYGKVESAHSCFCHILVTMVREWKEKTNLL